MENKDSVKNIRVFIWLIQYQIILKVIVHIISLVPFIYILVIGFESRLLYALLLILAISISPLLLIIQTGLLLVVFPRARPGEYTIFSKKYLTWLRRNIIAEYVSSSSFMNNLVQRSSLLKILYYGMLGYKSPASVILAPDVKLLDPDLCKFGGSNFVGYGSVISSHTIKGDNLILAESRIGKNVKIGSYCKMAVGISIGESTLIDYGVELGVKCRIGKISRSG